MQDIVGIYMKGYVPVPVWIGAAALALLIAGVGCFLHAKKRPAWPFVAMGLLVELAVLIICMTLVFRRTSDDYMLMWPPMWSYLLAYGGGTMHNLVANTLNILLFVPFGFLFRFAVRHSHWWTMLTVAFAFSFSIELAQLFTHRGFCEVDDIVHNSCGALIGYGIACLIKIDKLINES